MIRNRSEHTTPIIAAVTLFEIVLGGVLGGLLFNSPWMVAPWIMGLWVVVWTWVVVGVAWLTHQVVGGRQRGCGCWEWGPVGHDDFETVESETHWERKRDGAKVIWRKYRDELRRCEQCGGHFYDGKLEVETEREAWLEEEPSIMPDGEGAMEAEKS